MNGLSDFMQGWQGSERSAVRTIAVKPVYIDINDGYLMDGLIFSQIMYWFGFAGDYGDRTTVFRDGYKWLAKQYDDWWDECRVKERTARQAINRMVKRGILVKKLWHFGGRPMVHLRINFEIVEPLLKAAIVEEVAREEARIAEKAIRQNMSNRSSIRQNMSNGTGLIDKICQMDSAKYVNPYTESTPETTKNNKNTTLPSSDSQSEDTASATSKDFPAADASGETDHNLSDSLDYDSQTQDDVLPALVEHNSVDAKNASPRKNRDVEADEPVVKKNFKTEKDPSPERDTANNASVKETEKVEPSKKQKEKSSAKKEKVAKRKLYAPAWGTDARVLNDAMTALLLIAWKLNPDDRFDKKKNAAVGRYRQAAKQLLDMEIHPGNVGDLWRYVRDKAIAQDWTGWSVQTLPRYALEFLAQKDNPPPPREMDMSERLNPDAPHYQTPTYDAETEAKIQAEWRRNVERVKAKYNQPKLRGAS